MPKSRYAVQPATDEYDKVFNTHLDIFNEAHQEAAKQSMDGLVDTFRKIGWGKTLGSLTKPEFFMIMFDVLLEFENGMQKLPKGTAVQQGSQLDLDAF
jgi:hypothetical protein